MKEESRFDPKSRAVRVVGFIGGLASAFYQVGEIESGPFWDVFATHAGRFTLFFVVGGALVYFLSALTVGISMMLSEHEPIIKTAKGQWIFRIFLALIVFLLIPLIQVSCARG